MKYLPRFDILKTIIGDADYRDHDGYTLEISWGSIIIHLSVAKLVK